MDTLNISNQAKLPTKFGHFIIQSFKEHINSSDDCACPVEHLVAISTNLASKLNDKDCGFGLESSEKPPLLRVHSECLTGDVFGSRKCDCGGELAMAMQRIAGDEVGGIIIYLRQEGRGIGLFNKINAYALQDKGYDTVEANEALGFKSDERDYKIVGKILDFYNIKKVRLLTNNPRKIASISEFVEVLRDSIIVKSNPYNKQYLATKKAKLGHLL